MTDNTKKESPLVSRPAEPPKKRQFNGGLEPGSLKSGIRRTFVSTEEPDPDKEILAKVKSMDGREMRRWLKDPSNAQALSKALANRKQL